LDGRDTESTIKTAYFMKIKGEEEVIWFD